MENNRSPSIFKDNTGSGGLDSMPIKVFLQNKHRKKFLGTSTQNRLEKTRQFMDYDNST